MEEEYLYLNFSAKISRRLKEHNTAYIRKFLPNLLCDSLSLKRLHIICRKGEQTNHLMLDTTRMFKRMEGVTN